jgi:hypothetical protein
MTEHSFTTTFSVDQTPQEVFAAITNVPGWWSEEVRGGTTQAGDVFTYHFEDVHRCKMRVTEAVPGRKVSWLVVENYFDFIADQGEWVDTTISFDITEAGGRTVVDFRHDGLVEQYECFEVCTKAWDFYIGTSLRNLIVTGEGQPNGPGTPRVAAEELAAAQGRS